MAPSNSRSSTPATTADATAASRSSDPVGGDVDDGEAAEAREEEDQLRRGPWTVDEDLALVNYITGHGEGRWNSLAQAAGLKRTGKSCRLRWLNYLRPDVKRGNFTADEQLLILDLHSRYGNRWSKIAQHLPGRTDNEIKNYWRTRVQKHAKQLNCDANSKRFKDAMRYLWMPHHLVGVDVDGNGADRHRGLLLHGAAVEPPQRQQPSSAGVDDQDGRCCDYYYDDGATAAMSGVGVTSSTTSDSYSYDAVPKNKRDPPPPSSSYDVVDASAGAGAAALYYADDDDVVRSDVGREQALLLNGDDWVVQEMMINQQQGQLQLWPPEQQKAAPAVQVVSNGSGGAAAQFELDAELSGWVQSFSNAENFWTFEDI